MRQIAPSRWRRRVKKLLWLDRLDISDREKFKRAESLGPAGATVGCLAMAPFWLVAAARFGKERRAQAQRT
jgi:hypothetical protein